MQPMQDSLIDELEEAVKAGSREDRVNTLRRVTDLFLNDADRLNDQQIGVFDDVLCLLAARIESTALVELSRRLAPVENAPLEVIRRLARDKEIAVAQPVLSESKRLTTSDLIEIARDSSQAHLLAISDRSELESTLTDVLLDRGGKDVVDKLASNGGVRFSTAGFDMLVRKAEGDDGLAQIVGLRIDIPVGKLRELLQRATEMVRSQILAMASPQMRETIARVIADVARSIGGAALDEPDFAQAERMIRAMARDGNLNEAALRQFLNRGQYEEMTAALAYLCSAPAGTVASILAGPRNDAVLLPCKAAKLAWATVEAILRERRPKRPVPAQVIELARNDYAKLSMVTAQRTLRFMQIRENVK
jgi:uncharacterized protein (DUF2336 family)